MANGSIVMVHSLSRNKRHPLMGCRGWGSKIESLGSEEREEER